MNHKKYLLAAAFAVSLVTGQTALANSHECGEGLTRMVDSLHVTNDQKAKIKPILEQLESGIKEQGSQMKDLRTQISQQVQSDTMDQATLDGLIDKKSKILGDMMKAKSNAVHQVYTMLNTEQKTKFQSMSKNMEEKIAKKYKNCHEDD